MRWRQAHALRSPCPQVRTLLPHTLRDVPPTGVRSHPNGVCRGLRALKGSGTPVREANQPVLSSPATPPPNKGLVGLRKALVAPPAGSQA